MPKSGKKTNIYITDCKIIYTCKFEPGGFMSREVSQRLTLDFKPEVIVS